MRRKEHERTERLTGFERNRMLPALALTVIAGDWLATRVTGGLWPLWLLAPAAILLLTFKRLRLPLRWACLPVALLLMMFWTQAWLNPAMPQAGHRSDITATEYGEPVDRTGGRIAVMLSNVRLDGVLQLGMAYCTLEEKSGVSESALFDGAALRLEGTIYLPFGKENEYDFDFRLWMLQNGLNYGISGVRNLAVLNTRETAPWADGASRIRAFCGERFRQWMGAESSLAMAMLLGDRDALAEEEQLAFQRAGVAHLMAVSGLHVGLLAGALLWLMNFLSLRKSFQLPVMAIFLMLYCGITGFSPAALRASVTVLLLMIARATGRKADSLATLSAAAVIVLVMNPLQLYSAGFVLSFSALAGILILHPRFSAGLERMFPKRKASRKRGAIRRWLSQRLGRPREVLAVSLAAQIGVLLPTAAYFHLLPLYGLAFNMIAVPLAGLLVPLYALTLLLSLLPWVGGALGAIFGFTARWGSRLLLWLVGLSGQLPYAQIRVPSPNLWAYAGLLVCVLAASRLVHAPLWRRVTAAALAVLIACGGAYATRPASLRYHQFAVGQGDASLIVDGDATVAIDVGPYGGEMAGRLLAEGRSLDALILTHLHSDHAQGIQTLLDDGITIRHIYLPDGVENVTMGDDSLAILNMLKQSGIPVSTLSAGETLSFHRASIRVLWPQKGCTREGTEANDRSVAMLIQLGRVRILNEADNSENYEPYFSVACDVLKVGHHGSKTSSSDAFLNVANPSLAIVTCTQGAALPSAETLMRLIAHGAQILRTDETGELILEARGDGYLLRSYKAR